MFQKPSGLIYYDFFKELHKTHLFNWHLEVGCRRGDSLVGINGKTIAVDPFFRINQNVVGNKPSMLLFQQKSDEFFDSKFLVNSKIKLGFSFLDGMHLMEYLLRDFIATEASTDKRGAISMHDCVPFNMEMTTRDLDNIPRRGRAWTGDVWKLIPILQKYRPELELAVVDCAPTGIVLASKLDPKNTVLIENYDAILEEFQNMSLEDFGVDRFFKSFEMLSAQSIVDDGFSIVSGAALSNSAAFQPVRITP